MKNSKLLFPVAFFVITLFTELATTLPSEVLHPCSSIPFAPADTFYSDFDCGVGSIICCYLPNSAAIVARIFT